MESVFSTFFGRYAPLSKELKDEIDQLATKKTYAQHELMLRNGQSCRYIRLIAKGVARMYYVRDGKDITSEFFFEHSIAANMESLYSQRPSQYTIEVVEKCDVIELRYKDLEELYKKHHTMERIGRRIAVECFLEERARNQSFQLQTAKKRYHQLLENNKHVLQRAPLKHIASFLGISQVQLSRIRQDAATI